MGLICQECNKIYSKEEISNKKRCPNCNEKNTIVYYDRVCFNCLAPLTLNEYLANNVMIDFDNLSETLTHDIVEEKNTLMKNFDNKDIKFLCCRCCEEIVNLKSKGIDKYIDYVKKNYDLLKRGIEYKEFIKKRVLIFNLYTQNKKELTEEVFKELIEKAQEI